MTRLAEIMGLWEQVLVGRADGSIRSVLKPNQSQWKFYEEFHDIKCHQFY